jgi:hypothetical protein
MLVGDCSKCKASGLPVKDGQLAVHMSSGKPCDWGIPERTYNWDSPPFINNIHLSFFQNMSMMLDILEEVWEEK